MEKDKFEPTRYYCYFLFYHVLLIEMIWLFLAFSFFQITYYVKFGLVSFFFNNSNRQYEKMN